MPSGVDPLVYWLAGVMITALVSAVVALWRLSVAEGKRKDQLIDELIVQIGRTADVQDRTVSVVEQRERGRR